MPHSCSLCTHDLRVDFERDLIDGMVLRNVALKYKLSKSGLHRHMEHAGLRPHALKLAKTYPPLPVPPSWVPKSKRDRENGTLMSKMLSLEEIIEGIVERSVSAENYTIALMASRELVRMIELQAKLAGKLGGATTNIMVASPEWALTRTRILEALEAYPEARTAVLRAIVGKAAEEVQTVTVTTTEEDDDGDDDEVS